MTFGVKAEFEVEYETEIDRNGDILDSLALETALSVAFAYDPSRSFRGFIELEISGDALALSPEGKGADASLEIEQAYLYLSRIGGSRFSFQIGRQRFNDEREWLYDRELDAARLYYEYSDLLIEMSASRENLVLRDIFGDTQKSDFSNYLIHARRRFSSKSQAAGYAILRDGSGGESRLYLGVQSHGRIQRAIEYWLEAAHMGGSDGTSKASGFALDVGALYKPDAPFNPSVTVGFAFGAGDGDTQDGVNKNFRQTGIQDNSDKFAGVVNFKYYGEFLNPELSNLYILTLGIGIKPTKRSSIDLVYHRYLQHKASDRFRGAGIDLNPSGTSRDIGSAVDIIIGYEELDNTDISLKFGYFSPGEAFSPHSAGAFVAAIELQCALRKLSRR
ncbi:MAG: alginate export family protein [Deltaproteobacteria bacterium]